MPSDLHQRASLPSELLSLDLLRPFVLEKDEWFRTDSGTSYRLSKSKAPLSCRKAHPQPNENTTSRRICQQEIIDFHRLPPASTGAQEVGAKALRRTRFAELTLRAPERWILQMTARLEWTGSTIRPRRAPIPKASQRG